MNYFDGRKETVRLENGRRFGIPPAIYQQLAQCAISAYEFGGIEPILLEPLESGKPGALCVLFGKKFSFTIQIEIEPAPPIVALGMVGLDEATQPLPVVTSVADSFATWRLIVTRMLEAEEYEFGTWEQWDEYLRATQPRV